MILSFPFHNGCIGKRLQYTVVYEVESAALKKDLGGYVLITSGRAIRVSLAMGAAGIGGGRGGGIVDLLFIGVYKIPLERKALVLSSIGKTKIA